MRIAVWQGCAQVSHLDANLAAISDAAKDAAERQADVLVTPELFVTGYEPESAAAVSDADLDDAMTRLSEIAAQHEIALVASLPAAREDGRRHIAAYLWDKDGQQLLSHRKVHLFGPDEKGAFASASKAPRTVSVDGVNVSLLICYDVEFPEMAREAAAAGADVILAPTALAGDYDAVPDILVRARALENHVVVAYSNHVGHEGDLTFNGHSIIAGADGEVLARAGETPEIVLADVDLDSMRESREAVPYIQDRRPGLYRTWPAT